MTMGPGGSSAHPAARGSVPSPGVPGPIRDRPGPALGGPEAKGSLARSWDRWVPPQNRKYSAPYLFACIVLAVGAWLEHASRAPSWGGGHIAPLWLFLAIYSGLAGTGGLIMAFFGDFAEPPEAGSAAKSVTLPRPVFDRLVQQASASVRAGRARTGASGPPAGAPAAAGPVHEPKGPAVVAGPSPGGPSRTPSPGTMTSPPGAIGPWVEGVPRAPGAAPDWVEGPPAPPATDRRQPSGTAVIAGARVAPPAGTRPGDREPGTSPSPAGVDQALLAMIAELKDAAERTKRARPTSPPKTAVSDSPDRPRGA